MPYENLFDASTDDEQKKKRQAPAVADDPAQPLPTQIGMVGAQAPGATGALSAPPPSAPPPGTAPPPSAPPPPGMMSGGPVNTAPLTPPPPTPAPPPAATDWTNYSPMAGKTEAEKQAWFASAGGDVRMLQGYVAPEGGESAADARATFDAAHPGSADVSRQIAAETAAKLAATSAAQTAANRSSTLDEINRAAGEFAAGPGAFRGEEGITDPGAQTREDFINRQLAASGQAPLAPSGDAAPFTPEYINALDRDHIASHASGGGSAVGNTSSIGIVGSNPGMTSLTPVSRTNNPANPTTPNTATGAAASTPGATVTPFGPENDLQSSQITPSAGPNRGDIAQGYLDAFDTRAEPMLRDKMRAVGQRAASLGRLGMGDTAVEALTPYTDYLKERAALSSELASRSAEGQIGDERSNRGELRTERDFQNRINRQAIDDAIQQWVLQQQGRQQEFNNGVQLGQFGYGNNPGSLVFGAGQQYGANAGSGMEAFFNLLGQYMTNSQRRTAA